MKEIKETILLMGVIVLTPLVFLCGLLLLNSINPMQLAFITRFNV